MSWAVRDSDAVTNFRVKCIFFGGGGANVLHYKAHTYSVIYVYELTLFYQVTFVISAPYTL